MKNVIRSILLKQPVFLFQKKRPWPRQILLLILTLVCLLTLGKVIGQHYRIGLDFTHCLPYRVYLLDLSDTTPQHRQSIYAFRAQGMEPVFIENTWMVKRLVGLPGDIVAITSDEQVRVNRDNLRQGLPVAQRLGWTTESFVGWDVLGPRQYWVLGDSVHSFDSRYWGALRAEQIIGRAYPLL